MHMLQLLMYESWHKEVGHSCVLYRFNEAKDWFTNSAHWRLIIYIAAYVHKYCRHEIPRPTDVLRSEVTLQVL